MIKEPIKKGLKILSTPREEFDKLNNKSLESVVADYMKLLVMVAIAAAAFNLIYALFRGIYLDIFMNADVQYWRMINYSMGRSVSTLFLYFFSGTFLLFFLSLILKIFLIRIKYTSMLKIMFYSLTPFLLFSWIFFNPLPLAIWSVFLFIMGVKTHRSEQIKNKSIDKRE